MSYFQFVTGGGMSGELFTMELSELDTTFVSYERVFMQYSITKKLSKKAINLFLYPYPPTTGCNVGFNIRCPQHIADIWVILGHKGVNTNTCSYG